MRGPVTLLKDAWGIFVSNPKLFIGIYLLPGIVMLIWSLFIYAQDVGSIAASPLSVLVAVVLFITLIVVNIMMGVAMIKAVAEPQTMTVGAAYGQAKQYFWPYVWLGLLVAVVTVLGFIALIIPGIIFMVWFAFSYFVLIFEDKHGTEAMKASKAYVKGKWWAVFGRYAFLVLIGIFVSVVVGMLTAVVESGIENIGGVLVSVIANVVIVPVAVAYSYLMYKDLSSGRSSSQMPSTPTVDADAA